MPAIKGAKVREKEGMCILIFVCLVQIFVGYIILIPDTVTNCLVVLTGTITDSAFIRNV